MPRKRQASGWQSPTNSYPETDLYLVPTGPKKIRTSRCLSVARNITRPSPLLPQREQPSIDQHMAAASTVSDYILAARSEPSNQNQPALPPLQQLTAQPSGQSSVPTLNVSTTYPRRPFMPLQMQTASTMSNNELPARSEPTTQKQPALPPPKQWTGKAGSGVMSRSHQRCTVADPYSTLLAERATCTRKSTAPLQVSINNSIF